MKNTMNTEIYCDVDGVFYNINKVAIDYSNLELGMNYDYRKNKSWWWKDTGVNQKYYENLLEREGVFYNGEVIDCAIEYLTKLYNEGYPIKFISSPQWDSKWMMYERVKFFRETLPWFNPCEHLILTSDKSVCCKKNRVLIDDYPNNLNMWNGLKICFNQPYNEDYNGLKAYNWEDVYNLIHKIESKFKENSGIDLDNYKRYMEREHNE